MLVYPSVFYFSCHALLCHAKLHTSLSSDSQSVHSLVFSFLLRVQNDMGCLFHQYLSMYGLWVCGFYPQVTFGQPGLVILALDESEIMLRRLIFLLSRTLLFFFSCLKSFDDKNSLY